MRIFYRLFFQILFIFIGFQVYAQKNPSGTVNIYSENQTPSAKYTSSKLSKWLVSKGKQVQLSQPGKYIEGVSKKTAYILINLECPSDANVYKSIFKAPLPVLKSEGFILEKSKSGDIFIVGADSSGVLYGVNELIERLEMGNSKTDISCSSQPAFPFRGIKFNLPWSTYRVHESLSLHYETCRDLKFWEKYLDMMAENRFNHLTLWAIHPWTYMVRPLNYPEACPFNDKELAEWQQFWHTLFGMAQERCIKVLMVNWNIFVSPEFSKAHNVATYSTDLGSGYTGKGDYSKLVQDYNKEIVSQVLKEYPELAGMGISQNERMEGFTDEIWQDWIADTYFDVLANSGGNRELMMRGHTHPRPDLTRKALENNSSGFKGPVWLSLKFNWSHSYASPTLFYIHGGSTSDEFWNPTPLNYKILFKIRNEDFFILRWGNSGYIKELLARNNQYYIGGFTIGSETYIPAKEYTTKPGEHLTWDYAFEKQWLSYVLWGRLLYNPKTSDEVFEHAFDKRYRSGVGKPMLRASAKAGNMPLQLATYYSSSWDFTLYSEGFLSGATQTWRGQSFDDESAFLSIDEIINSKPLDTNWMNIADYVDKLISNEPILPSKFTPDQLANKLKEDANEALTELNRIKKPSPTLQHEIADQKAWAYLSLYFSSKLSAGIDFQHYRKSGNGEKKISALQHIKDASAYWEQVCLITDPFAKEIPLLHFGDPYYTTQFKKPVKQFSWRAFSDQVHRDYEIIKNEK